MNPVELSTTEFYSASKITALGGFVNLSLVGFKGTVSGDCRALFSKKKHYLRWTTFLYFSNKAGHLKLFCGNNRSNFKFISKEGFLQKICKLCRCTVRILVENSNGHMEWFESVGLFISFTLAYNKQYICTLLLVD